MLAWSRLPRVLFSLAHHKTFSDDLCPRVHWTSWIRAVHICKWYFLWFHLNLWALHGWGVATQMLQHSQSHSILSSESGCSSEFLGIAKRLSWRQCKNGIFLLPLHVGVSVYGSSSGVGRLQLWAESCPPPALVNNVLLEITSTHSHVVWLLLWDNTRVK